MGYIKIIDGDNTIKYYPEESIVKIHIDDSFIVDIYYVDKTYNNKYPEHDVMIITKNEARRIDAMLMGKGIIIKEDLNDEEKQPE